ncbi:MAG: glycosyltransferase involved in cell wall biosynthesis [Desulforhopalus sp.]
MLQNDKSKESILVIAPQPFFQNRGTPIAVKLLVEELVKIGYDVHLLVFHEGEDVELPGVQIHRAPAPLGVHNIPPSISWKKIVCDIFMFFKGLILLRRYRYTLVHAVEESVFMAMVYKVIFNTPYVYDMDSSLAQQLIEKIPFLRYISSGLEFFEKSAIKMSCGVVAVCRELEEIVLSYAPLTNTVRLEDISLVDDTPVVGDDLREKYDITGPIMLYVGNLEGYQGIDLLFESFQLALKQGCSGNVVIIGGTEKTISQYKILAEQLGISSHVYFCGPRPLQELGHYLNQADILLSPRIQGNNTPMKLYSYLGSGKAVLATDLSTHTQVLTSEISCLAPPSPEGMAKGILDLLDDKESRMRIGKAGKEEVEKKYSLSVYQEKLRGFYSKIIANLAS